MSDQSVKNYCNNYRFGLDMPLSNNFSSNNNMISISTNALKSIQPQLIQQQPALNNLSPNFGANNIRNNRLGQKYIVNSNSNYYESFSVNPIACNSNIVNPLSPLMK